MTWIVLTVLVAAPPVALEVDPCVGEVAALEQHVALELGAAEGSPAVASERDVTRVRVSCSDGLVVVEVVDPTTGKSARRRIEPGPVSGSARLRVLALAIAELISASWVELSLRATPAAAVDATASAPTRAAAQTVIEHATSEPPPLPWLMAAQVQGFSFVGNQRAVGLGVRLGVERSLAWRVGLRSELGLDHLAQREPLGSLDALLFSAALGAQLHPPAPIPLSLGLAARVGLARLNGQPDDPNATAGFTRTGPWFGASLNGRVRVAPNDRAGLVIGVEAGVVMWPFLGARSDGRPWGVDGGWLSLQVGWELPW